MCAPAKTVYSPSTASETLRFQQISSDQESRIGPLAGSIGSQAVALALGFLGAIGQPASTICEVSPVRILIASTLVTALFVLQRTSKNVHDWVDGVSSTTTCAINKVSSNPTLSKLRTSMGTSSMKLLTLASKQAARFGGRDRYHVLSSKVSFVSETDTEKLSLSDLAEVYHFSINLNRPGSSHKVLTGPHPTLQNAIDALESAVALSRGVHNQISEFPASASYGDIDALAFVAACRIFADWRTLRLVPEGYQRYAVGMKLAHRDLLQNISKTETSIHRYMDHAKETSNLKSSPTLRQLLQFEVDQKVHRRLPRLHDKSGANGLLWILRQVRYQTRILANLSQVPVSFPNGKAANTAAYQSTYGDYHGFFTRQIFQASFDSAPEAETILQHLSMSSLEDISRATSFSSEEEDSEDYPEECDSLFYLELDTSERALEEDTHKVGHPTIESTDTNPAEQIRSHMVSEWMKFLRFFEQCGGAAQNPVQYSRNAVDSRPLFVPPSRVNVEQEMSIFVDSISPVLDDLDNLLEKFNMNDPSRV